MTSTFLRLKIGLFAVEDLQNLRKIDSDLDGHPMSRLNFINVGTVSLGQDVAVAWGMAYVGKFFDRASYRYNDKFIEKKERKLLKIFFLQMMVNLPMVQFGNH